MQGIEYAGGRLTRPESLMSTAAATASAALYVPSGMPSVQPLAVQSSMSHRTACQHTVKTAFAA